MTDSPTDAATLLPRERTAGLSDRARRVGPPPTPVLTAPYAARLADADRDAELIAEWMNRPHLAETWEYAWPVPRWHDYLLAQLHGTYSRPMVISRRGEPGAYIEVYRAAKDSISTRYEAEPHDLGVHAAIAALDIVNRGVAPRLLPRLAASLFELEPRCERVMFDPDHRNTAARRLCEYVGCEFLGEHDMPNRRMALYALPRPAVPASASLTGSSGPAPNNSA